MRLSRLLADLPICWLCPGDVEVTQLTVDQREACPGALYVARRGYYGDGHARIPEALAAGASALLVSDPDRVPAGVSVPVALAREQDPLLGDLSARFYGRPTAALRVYGVTGTNGKTSVAFLLEHMLRAVGERPALMGTIEYRLGDHAHPAVNTTPDALFVQRFARQALDAGATSLVLEVSSHALAIGRSAAVLFDRVGFTNLTHEHLDFHGTMDAYRDAKTRLFSTYLELARSSGKRPLAVACVDDPAGWHMLARVPPGVPTLAVRTDGPWAAAKPREPDVEMVRLESLGVAGCRFRVSAPTGRWSGRTALLGRHNLANVALAAAMVGADDPRRWEAALASLAHFPGVVGRMEPVAAAADAQRGVFVDYAHSPDALDRALGVLRELDAGPVTVVVGCGGDRDRSKRGPMARVAQTGAHRVILTSDNPRSEAPERILDEMMAGIDPLRPPPERVVDRAEAIDRAIGATPAGPILIAGKGHEHYQERERIRYHFDDREEACRAWVARRHGLRARGTPLVVGWSTLRLARALAGRPLTETERASVVRVDPGDAVELERDPGGKLRVGFATARLGLVLDDAQAAHGRLLCEIVAEARRRPLGLWTAWVVAEREQHALELARVLAALQPAESVRIAAAPVLGVDFAGAVSCLTPEHRGLVLTASAKQLDRSAVGLGRLAPELLLATSPVAARAARCWIEEAGDATCEPLLFDEPRLVSLTSESWTAVLDRMRRLMLARWQAPAVSRPIPVPDGLTLVP